MIPLNTAPAALHLQKWQDLNSLLQRIENDVLACRLRRESFLSRKKYLEPVGIYINDTHVIKYTELEQGFNSIHAAITKTNKAEYGARYRNNDFDILLPDVIEKSPSLSAAFIPIMIGSVIIAGCFALLHRLGKDADETETAYKKLSKEADKIICQDPHSELCKNWEIVKVQEQIEIKESFADSLKKTASKALNIGLAVVIGVIALNVWSKIK